MASYHAGRASKVIDEALRPVLEPLESRTLLSASLDNGTLNIVGTEGNDTIQVRPGKATDLLKVSVNDEINFFKLADVTSININALGGNDGIQISEIRAAVTAPATILGGAGDDSIQGGGGDDLLLGGDGNDRILGGRGDDNLDGGDGADTLLASSGVDSINGGDGDDLIGKSDDDDIITSSGNDKVESTANNHFPIQTFTGTPSGYTVRQMRAAYGFGDLEDPTFTNRGKGQTIVIVIAYHAPRARQDLIEFAREQNTLPGVKNLNSYFKTHFHQVWTGGSGHKDSNEDWNGEAMLDIQWSHAIAPEAKIVLVEAPNNLAANLEASIDTAAKILKKTKSHGGVVSMSWGFLATTPEQVAFATAFDNPEYDNISFVVSSGDIGGLTSGTPVGPPNVTVVGGTKLFLDPFGNRVSGVVDAAPTPAVNGGLTPPPPLLDNWNLDIDCPPLGPPILDDTLVQGQFGISGGEGAWWEGGGGFSDIFEAPLWQQNRIGNQLPLNPLTGLPERGVPDVAYNADPRTGVPVFNSFGFGGQSGWEQVGGTSAGAPQFAALVTLANQLRALDHKGPIGGDLNERIYTLGGRGPDQYFHDIDVHGSGVLGTAGLAAACSDSGHAGGFAFNATPGWDPATGWGSPNASTLVPALANRKLKFTRRTVTFTGRISQNALTTGAPNPANVAFVTFAGKTTAAGYNTITMPSFRMAHVTRAGGGDLGGGGGTGGNNSTITAFIDLFGMDEQDGQPNVPAYSPTIIDPISGQGLLLAPGSPIIFSRSGDTLTGHAFYLVTITTTTTGGPGGGTQNSTYFYFPLQFRGKIRDGKITGDFFTVDLNGDRVKGTFNPSRGPVVGGTFEG